jgi:hypothetical protein
MDSRGCFLVLMRDAVFSGKSVEYDYDRVRNM